MLVSFLDDGFCLLEGGQFHCYHFSRGIQLSATICWVVLSNCPPTRFPPANFFSLCPFIFICIISALWPMWKGPSLAKPVSRNKCRLPFCDNLNGESWHHTNSCYKICILWQQCLNVKWIETERVQQNDEYKENLRN